MPRQARIDASGALHHIICRGIGRGNIFRDNTDRNRLLERLGVVLTKSATPCYAWTLIPNHFHLLLKTGNEIEKGAGLGRNPELTGGGLLRSVGG